jgi:hypothetical protein
MMSIGFGLYGALMSVAAVQACGMRGAGAWPCIEPGRSGCSR